MSSSCRVSRRAKYTPKLAVFGVYFARDGILQELLIFKKIQNFSGEIRAVTRYMPSFRQIGRPDISEKFTIHDINHKSER